MPKNPRGAKARAVGSVKRSQKTIRELTKKWKGTLTPIEVRNAFHEGYGRTRAKFEKRAAKKK
jgi:hypothetical protein